MAHLSDYLLKTPPGLMWFAQRARVVKPDLKAHWAWPRLQGVGQVVSGVFSLQLEESLAQSCQKNNSSQDKNVMIQLLRLLLLSVSLKQGVFFDSRGQKMKLKK